MGLFAFVTIITLQPLKLYMVEEEYRDNVMCEVSDFAGDSIKEFLDSLGDDWSPFVPEKLRYSKSGSFSCQPYAVSRTLLKHIIRVDFRVHKVLEAEEFIETQMLTINVFSTNNSIVVRALYVPLSDSNISKWNQVVDADSIELFVVEEREFSYSDSSREDYSHSDEEILEVLEEAIENVKELMEKYDKMSHKEIVNRV